MFLSICYARNNPSNNADERTVTSESYPREWGWVGRDLQVISKKTTSAITSPNLGPTYYSTGIETLASDIGGGFSGYIRLLESKALHLSEVLSLLDILTLYQLIVIVAKHLQFSFIADI